MGMNVVCYIDEELIFSKFCMISLLVGVSFSLSITFKSNRYLLFGFLNLY